MHAVAVVYVTESPVRRGGGAAAAGRADSGDQ